MPLICVAQDGKPQSCHDVAILYPAKQSRWMADFVPKHRPEKTFLQNQEKQQPFARENGVW